MSRLDPLRERQDFLDAVAARREFLGEERTVPEQKRIPPRPTGPSRGVQPPLDPAPREMIPEDSQLVLYDGDRGYRLRNTEIRTLVDLGKFRAVAVDDLAAYRYAGHGRTVEDDVRNLLRKGLVRQGTFEGAEANPRVLLTLTKRGHRLLRRNRVVPREQNLYHGFVKPREANHDANLYKLYQKESARIDSEGGRNPRVILDFELKRKINRDIAKLGREARPEIAERHGLRVVRGRIPVPDLRIEYERPDGTTCRVDLELVTEHYRGRSLADKVKAGFLLYTLRGESDRLRRVLDQQELTSEILSL